MDEQILEVTSLNGNTLSDPLIAYSSEENIYLPLLDLSRILGVKVEQTAPKIFKISRSDQEDLTLDLSQCNQTQSFECKSSFENRGAIYLKLEYLNFQLNWPLSVDLKSMRLIVNVAPQVRESYRQREINKKTPNTFLLTRKKFGYPAARIEATASSKPENHVLNLYETQPLLDHDSDIYISRRNEQTIGRWTLSKELVESTNPSSLQNYELISTQTADMKYLFSPTQITGLNLSNIKYNESIFDTQNFYERGPPRWRVELYVNEIYYGETTIDAEGNFFFLNIPLFYGQNRIHYKLTSPLGQTNDVYRTYNISNEFEGSGKVKYQASFGQAVNSRHHLGQGLVNYGVNSFMSAHVGFAKSPLTSDVVGEKRTQQHSIAGISFLQPQYSMSATQIASIEQNEKAWVFSPKLNVGRLFLTSEIANFSNFRSQLINS